VGKTRTSGLRAEWNMRTCHAVWLYRGCPKKRDVVEVLWVCLVGVDWVK
jgi:hypothetical protein